MAAEIIASLKDKNPNVVLELAVQNDAMICFAPNEIKTLFLENKIDLVHIEQKDHDPLDEKECYECMIDRSDFVIEIFDECKILMFIKNGFMQMQERNTKKSLRLLHRNN